MLLSAWRNQAPVGSGADAVGALKQELLRLGSMVEESAVLARAVLSGPDMEAAPQIRRGDDRIDKLYRRLEEECADLLCQKRLTQTQVREVLSFCLLYTSPSPRDATLSRMPSSA